MKYYESICIKYYEIKYWQKYKSELSTTETKVYEQYKRPNKKIWMVGEVKKN